MPTELFMNAKHPACFAPQLTADDLPRIRELLRRAGRNGLQPFEPPVNSESWPEVTQRAQQVLADRSGKFDRICQEIAQQYLTAQEHVSLDVYPVMYDALLAMAEKFFETGESDEEPVVVPVRFVMDGQTCTEVALTPLADDEVQRMWDLVPWFEEIEMYRLAASCLPAGVRTVSGPDGRRTEVVNQQDYAIKNASQSLIWYAHELFLDREPTTKERVARAL